ncbi:MAG: phospholipase A [Janthinobacterium lividum]
MASLAVSCAAAALLVGVCPVAALADVVVLPPPAIAPANQPLEIVLMFSRDEDGRAGAGAARGETVPPTLTATLTNGDTPPTPLLLHRVGDAPAVLRLRPGQFRKIRYQAPWPDAVRGTVRLGITGFNSAAALVTLDRGKNASAAVAAAAAAPPTAVAATAIADSSAAGKLPGTVPGAGVSPTAAAPNAVSESRLSFYEPFYLAAGINGDTTARFQISFKYRIIQPKDPASKALFDNLYFGYTQQSIWDLSQESAPFRDTSYKPSVFYYLPDVGVHSRWFDSIGLQTGFEHESNGKAGSQSRGINIAYVEPIIHFGNPLGNQLTIAPKVYYYLEKSDNEDIADYRGYADLLIKYGSADGLQLATTLRKGTRGLYGSVDAQLTYPLQRLLGGAWGGYAWLGYFNGYGEDLLDYNQRQHWVARIGYSIAR